MATLRAYLVSDLRWLALLALCLSTGCGPLKHWPDASWRHHPYYLIAIDTEAQMDLSFDSTRDGLMTLVGPTVYAVGINSRYVVVKQHPSSDGHKFDRAVTNYFIVDRETESGAGWRRKPKVLGPLTRSDFDQLGPTLQLPQFSKSFKSLEWQDTGE